MNFLNFLNLYQLYYSTRHWTIASAHSHRNLCMVSGGRRISLSSEIKRQVSHQLNLGILKDDDSLIKVKHFRLCLWSTAAKCIRWEHRFCLVETGEFVIVDIRFISRVHMTLKSQSVGLLCRLVGQSIYHIRAGQYAQARLTFSSIVYEVTPTCLALLWSIQGHQPKMPDYDKLFLRDAKEHRFEINFFLRVFIDVFCIKISSTYVK